MRVFDFFPMFRRLLLKVSEVITEHKNDLKMQFFLPKGKKNLGQSPPQELEECPPSGLYLLVHLNWQIFIQTILPCPLPSFPPIWYDALSNGPSLLAGEVWWLCWLSTQFCRQRSTNWNLVIESWPSRGLSQVRTYIWRSLIIQYQTQEFPSVPRPLFSFVTLRLTPPLLWSNQNPTYAACHRRFFDWFLPILAR